MAADKLTTKRILERRPGYHCVYYVICFRGEVIREIGPYKWNRPDSFYYDPARRAAALQGARAEAKYWKRELSRVRTSA